jgi:hypothetical protein
MASTEAYLTYLRTYTYLREHPTASVVVLLVCTYVLAALCLGEPSLCGMGGHGHLLLHSRWQCAAASAADLQGADWGGAAGLITFIFNPPLLPEEREAAGTPGPPLPWE